MAGEIATPSPLESRDSGPPVGYWALIRYPDGHTLEVAFGQELREVVERAD